MFIQILEYVIREVAQWLGTLTVLVEDPNLVSNTQTRRLINTSNSISRGMTPSFVL